ncbi:MAG: hypothetical protein H6R26_3463 [Proteobacteria bacterium]|nr:hypothetical protein [Pseudomonadota bacterium]
MKAFVFAAFAVVAFCLLCGQGGAAEPAHAHQKPRATAGAAKTQRVESKGVLVEFSAAPVEKAGTGLMEGEYADLSFRLTDAQTHRPIKGRIPGAWLDMDKPFAGKQAEPSSCKSKIETYLKGMLGQRPMLDLNSYYLMVFNQDASISVIDPLVGVSGRTNLFATIILKRPAADWVESRDGKRLFVSMPEAGQIAVIDTETFKVLDHIDAGARPTRLALQPDGHFLWVSNDGDTDDKGGVTAIDTDALKAVGHLSTGQGHHEIAFSADDRYAYVSNREKGGVSVVDIRTMQKLKDVKTGSLPIALAYSPAGRTLYVADGVDGTISAVGGSDSAVIASIQAKSGLGPMKLTADGRWLLAINSRENLVHVVEVATNRLVQDIPVGARPYEIAMSDAFAYVRSLDSEHVAMIALAQLGKDSALQLSTFTAGSQPPKQVPDLGIGTSMVPSVGEAAMLVASPADNLIYYYMEGMLAPSGNFRNPAHSARGLHVVDRSLRETKPGEYTARVKIPAAGDYDVAFLLESPRVIHCFHAQAAENPLLKAALKPLEIAYLTEQRAALVGQSLSLRFRLEDPKDSSPKPGLADVRVLYYAAPGLERTEVPAHEAGGGVYEATLAIKRPGAYYAYVAVPSQKVRYGDLTAFSLIATEPERSSAPASPVAAPR